VYHFAEPTAATLPSAALLAPVFDRAVALARAAWRKWQERRRLDAARREFARLDPAALRDLGMHAGEFESYWAEAHGRAPQTRRRRIERFAQGL
jgi:hypothetical protein